jgi:hypothetical protein
LDSYITAKQNSRVDPLVHINQFFRRSVRHHQATSGFEAQQVVNNLSAIKVILAQHRPIDQDLSAFGPVRFMLIKLIILFFSKFDEPK